MNVLLQQEDTETNQNLKAELFRWSSMEMVPWVCAS